MPSLRKSIHSLLSRENGKDQLPREATDASLPATDTPTPGSIPTSSTAPILDATPGPSDALSNALNESQLRLLSVFSQANELQSPSRLLQAIEALERETQNLRAWYNNMGPANSLPPEILHKIFIQGVTAEAYETIAPRRRPFLLVCTSVCSYWREVALAYPPLWSLLSNFDCAQLTQAQVSRSGRCPLDVIYHTNRTGTKVRARGDITAVLLIQTAGIILSQSDRLRSVDFTSGAFEGSAFVGAFSVLLTPRARSFPLLESLSFQFGNNGKEVSDRGPGSQALSFLDLGFLSKAAPRLSHFSLVHEDQGWINPPNSNSIPFGPSLTSLCLTNRAVRPNQAELLSALALAPNLQELSLTGIIPGHQGLSLPVVNLPHLRHINISDHHDLIHRFLGEYVQIPTTADTTLDFHPVAGPLEGQWEMSLSVHVFERRNRPRFGRLRVGDRASSVPMYPAAGVVFGLWRLEGSNQNPRGNLAPHRVLSFHTADTPESQLLFAILGGYDVSGLWEVEVRRTLLSQATWQKLIQLPSLQHLLCFSVDHQPLLNAIIATLPSVAGPAPGRGGGNSTRHGKPPRPDLTFTVQVNVPPGNIEVGLDTAKNVTGKICAILGYYRQAQTLSVKARTLDRIIPLFAASKELVFQIHFFNDRLDTRVYFDCDSKRLGFIYLCKAPEHIVAKFV